MYITEAKRTQTCIKHVHNNKKAIVLENNRNQLSTFYNKK